MPLHAFSDDFPGVVAPMLRASATGRVAHAYLVIGDDPDYLERFAKAWIQTRACTQPASDGDACGTCAHCQLFEHDNYPQLFIVRPQSKARLITVDEMREFEHKLGLTAGRGKLKAGLVLESDRMNANSQNAFLKTLEEPTPGTLLVLTSTQPRALLPTIRSRCQVVALRRNRPSYQQAVDAGLFPLLARLEPRSGAARALEVAGAIGELFNGLKTAAEERVGTDHDERWETVAADDPKLRKELKAQRDAHVEAEYRRLRGQMLDAVQTWFQQEVLIASGVETTLLPHAEFLVAAGVDASAVVGLDPELADRRLRHADRLVRFLSGNLNERLALEAFCLEACEKVASVRDTAPRC